MNESERRGLVYNFLLKERSLDKIVKVLPKRATSSACFTSTLPKEEPIQVDIEQPMIPSPEPINEPPKEPDPPEERGEGPCSHEDVLRKKSFSYPVSSLATEPTIILKHCAIELFSPFQNLFTINAHFCRS